MKIFVRTIENGNRLTLDAVMSRRNDVKEKLLSSGLHYVETEALLGSFSATGQRVEERVYVIEGVSEANYA